MLFYVEAAGKQRTSSIDTSCMSYDCQQDALSVVPTRSSHRYSSTVSTHSEPQNDYFFPLPPFIPLLLPFPPFFFKPTPSLREGLAPSLDPRSKSKALFFLPPFAPPPDVFRFLLADAFGSASVILTGLLAFLAARMEALAVP